MINKNPEEIGKGEIDALVRDGVKEGRTLEYKEALILLKDDDRKEFLADVSAFANSGGGLLLFGVTEKRDDKGKTTGVPEAAIGLTGINSDAEILRIEDLLRNGVAPKIPGLRVRSIDGFPNGPILMISVAKSWAAPHMVTFRQSSRFFVRTSAGKHQLDVAEIRAAFLASDALPQRMAHFRTDRVGKILSGESPVVLSREPTVIVHLLPVASFGEPFAIDLSGANRLSGDDFHVMYSSFASRRHFNFDGLLAYDQGFDHYSKATTNYSYLQLFRNAVIEGVCTGLLHEGKVALGMVESRCLEAVTKYLALMRKLQVETPIFVAITLVSIKDREPGTGRPTRDVRFSKPFDRDVLVVPEIVVESYEEKLPTILRPAFDSLWQAGGWPRSPHYDENGDRQFFE